MHQILISHSSKYTKTMKQTTKIVPKMLFISIIIQKQQIKNQSKNRKQEMGSTSCSSQQNYQTRFRNKYEFITLVADHNFGEIKVYRKKQINYDYVMVLHKYVQTSKLGVLVKEIQAIHAAFLKQNQPMALRIFNFDIDDNQISNCSLSLVKIYVQYFNFTLKDLIDAHRAKGDGFTFQQLKYILYSCVLTYEQFLSITQKNINLSPESIYLSPQGYIKFCPIRSQQFFQHNNPVCNILCNETVYKQLTTIDRGQKYLLTQLRKIFEQISSLNYIADPDHAKIFSFFEQLQKCSRIQHLTSKLGSLKIESLNIANKIEGSTVEEQNKGFSNMTKSSTNKPISISGSAKSQSQLSFRARTNESQSVKLSLTRNTKVTKQKEEVYPPTNGIPKANFY